ncbi:Protein of unknown function [Amycolatopsis marina]|uniref:DUF4239 domain-containing protein n=1 Tax=Amycolatopsis marina TaxID=490629 RepID=A0A1I1BI49_9PSEU|nr:DUF4239 domain-containing protein [Amycolatopsis marina]SFB50054.1 Protein of unknown function [Amycolatopsis marina]
MNIYLSGVIWVVGASAVAGVSAYVVRRFGQDEGRPGNNDAAGQVFTIVAGLHAVLVAFVLIAQFDAVTQARKGSYTEAQALVAAAWSADSLPEPTRSQVRAHSADYASTVLDEEWPQMRADTEVSRSGWEQLDRIQVDLAKAKADENWQEERKTRATEALTVVAEARQQRVQQANGDQVGAVVWFALILGSVISTLLPNLFGGTRLGTHVIIVSTLAGTITLLLFAIYQLQNPFSGGAVVEPDAFRNALERLR